MSDLIVDGIIASTGTNTALTLQGKGTGTVDIGDGALSFPDADGSASQVIKTDGSGTLAFTTLTSGFTLATEQATTSGSAITFGSIPSGTKMIVVMFAGVSWDSTGAATMTIGDSGGLETSGYVGQYKSITTAISSSILTAAFPVSPLPSAGFTMHGTATLTLEDSTNFTWTYTCITALSSDNVTYVAASKTLSAELTQLSFITANTFDLGGVNIMYI